MERDLIKILSHLNTLCYVFQTLHGIIYNFFFKTQIASLPSGNEMRDLQTSPV